MGGKIDWAALPLVAEYIEAADLDLLVDCLIIIDEIRSRHDD